MSMMMSHILKLADSPKTQKSNYLENKSLFFSSNKKALIWQKKKVFYRRLSSSNRSTA